MSPSAAAAADVSAAAAAVASARRDCATADGGLTASRGSSFITGWGTCLYLLDAFNAAKT